MSAPLRPRGIPQRISAARLRRSRCSCRALAHPRAPQPRRPISRNWPGFPGTSFPCRICSSVPLLPRITKKLPARRDLLLDVRGAGPCCRDLVAGRLLELGEQFEIRIPDGGGSQDFDRAALAIANKQQTCCRCDQQSRPNDRPPWRWFSRGRGLIVRYFALLRRRLLLNAGATKFIRRCRRHARARLREAIFPGRLQPFDSRQA